MNSFNNLATVRQVQEPLKPAALRIYKSIFPSCKIEDLRAEGVKVHVLDQEFGIDSLIHLESGQWFSIQEKYRHYPKWKWHDFTQEVENGDGTPGEWQKLGAQFYFYGWGDPQTKSFMEWFILNIPEYKLIIERCGGIYKSGKIQQNKLHGRAKFVGVPYLTIRPAIYYFGNSHIYCKRLDGKTFSQPMPILKQ